MWGQQLKYRSVVTKTFILAAIEFYNCIIKACVDFATVSNACGGLFRFVSFRFVSFRFVSFRFVSFRFVSFRDRKSTRLNSSHSRASRMPSSA